MTDPLTMATVGDIVATDFRTAGIFEQFGIDFCCGGRQSLADACRAATVDPDVVIRALDTLPPPLGGDEDVAAWPISRGSRRNMDRGIPSCRACAPISRESAASFPNT